MLKIGKEIFYSVIYICCIISICRSADAQLSPQNWPWRGITVLSALSLTEITANDIRYFASININAVEMILMVRSTAKRYNLSPDKALEKNMQWADRLLDECKKQNITGILTIGEIPIDPKLGITQISPEFWNDPKRYEEAVEIAGIISNHFKNRGKELGAYEFFSEPVIVSQDGKSKLPEVWPHLMKEIIKKIREVDQERYIIVTPGIWGMPEGYKNFQPLDDQHIIYDAHVYIPHQYTHQGLEGIPFGIKYPGIIGFRYWNKKELEDSISPLIEFQNKYKKLVWIGEFSAVRWAPGGDDYVRDLIDVFDSHGWGWSYFCYNSYHGWNPDYDNVLDPKSPNEWQKHYVGHNSNRWQLLMKAYLKNKR